MKKLGAAAIFALVAATMASAPAQAESQSGMVASGVRNVPSRGPGGGFGYSGRFKAGNFPIPGIAAPFERFGRRDFFRFGYHRPERPDRPDRPDRPFDPDHSRHHDRDGYGSDYGYDYGYGSGIGYGYLPSRDSGFASGGERSRSRDGYVAYDYDRGYPYDHYRPRERRESAYQSAQRERSCEVEWVRGGQSGQRVPVKVCRN